MFRIVKHRKPGICVAHGCMNNHTKKDRFCSKHSHRFQKAKNTLSYTYNLLKGNASRRNKEFNITLEEFRIWCDENNYINEKGKTSKSASIDRIDPEKGYEIGNIQKMSLGENTRKMVYNRYKKEGDPEYDDLPF